MPALTTDELRRNEELRRHHAELDEAQRVREREESRARIFADRQRREQAALVDQQRREDIVRERAAPLEAQRAEGQRRAQQAAEEAQRTWVERRDRLEAELTDARAIQALVNAGNVKGLSLEQSVALQAEMARGAAEALVARLETEVKQHKARH